MQQRPPVQRPGNGAGRPAAQTRRSAVQPGQRPQSRPAAQQSRQRPAQKPPASGNGWIRPALWSIAAVAVLVLAYVLQYVLFPGGLSLQAGDAAPRQLVTEISGVSDLQFSEIMSSNSRVLMDDAGEYPDWIELVNAGKTDMDITGYIIAKQTDTAQQFTFPQMVLEAGGRVIVFCDNTLADQAGQAFHAPFRISAAGDALMLFNPGGTAVEAINVPALEPGTVYSRTDAGEWQVSAEYTPGMANTAENHATLVGGDVLVSDPVAVTEFMAVSRSYMPQDGAEAADWIEIANTGAQSVSLKGYGLSDDRTRPVKWRFPDVTLAPGERLVVWCDGANRTDGGALHTNFALGAELESVILTNPNGQMIACIDYDILQADQSMALQADGAWTISDAPTPGN